MVQKIKVKSNPRLFVLLWFSFEQAKVVQEELLLLMIITILFFSKQYRAILVFTEWNWATLIGHCVSIFECPREDHNLSSCSNPGQYLALSFTISDNILDNIRLYGATSDNIV